jgi:hypothetical protein
MLKPVIKTGALSLVVAICALGATHVAAADAPSAESLLLNVQGQSSLAVNRIRYKSLPLLMGTYHLARLRPRTVNTLSSPREVDRIWRDSNRGIYGYAQSAITSSALAGNGLLPKR